MLMQRQRLTHGIASPMVQLGKMSTDLQSKLDDHETRLSAVERRQDAQGDKLDSISRDLSAIRAEGNARAVSAAHSIDQVRGDIHGLTVQLAEYTGAQKRQTELEALKTQRWQRVSIILGVVFAFGAMLISWQEIASYIWVDILHLKEPW